MAADDPLARTEDWFLARGVPHFIADYRASTDIWTRALPALTLLFLVELAVLAPNRAFPIWLDVAVVAALFALALGGWALVNRARGRRPLARPDDLGPLEVAAFVVVPAAVPLVFGGQVRQGLVTLAVNVALLGVVYVATSYGVVPMTRWALGRLVAQSQSVVSLLARALPLLALLVTFLFLTAEVWQAAGTLHGPAYWLALGLFVAVGVAFVVVRLPRDVGELNRFGDPGELVALVRGTPIEPVTPQAGATEPPPLGRREWGNVGLVALFGQGVQIVAVSALIGGFFVVLGLLVVGEETTRSWAGEVNRLAALDLGGRELVVTEQLLRVAGFLTAFSGLNYTVYLLTDATYRREFREEVVADLRQAFAVRAAYRAAVDRRAATMPPT